MNASAEDGNQHERDYATGLEEPFIDGAEPTSARELVYDSLPDANTVDDGIFATDPDDGDHDSGGWSFQSNP